MQCGCCDVGPPWCTCVIHGNLCVILSSLLCLFAEDSSSSKQAEKEAAELAAQISFKVRNYFLQLQEEQVDQETLSKTPGRGVLGRKLGGGVPLMLSNPDPIQEMKL